MNPVAQAPAGFVAATILAPLIGAFVGTHPGFRPEARARVARALAMGQPPHPADVSALTVTAEAPNAASLELRHAVDDLLFVLVRVSSTSLLDAIGHLLRYDQLMRDAGHFVDPESLK